MIGGIFEADGDIFDMPEVNRGVFVLERNGNKEKGRVKYQFMDEAIIGKVKASLSYDPFMCSEDIEYHLFRVKEEIGRRTGKHIDLMAFNIFRN